MIGHEDWDELVGIKKGARKMRRMFETHTHHYQVRALGLGGEPDLVCCVCGLRIPRSMEAAARAAGATVCENRVHRPIDTLPKDKD